MSVIESTAPAAGTTRRLSTAKAISEAIGQEMERDPAVFVMGEDVGPYGGIFGSTGGLFEQFGPDRIIDTPISETGFIGAGIGAATCGRWSSPPSPTWSPAATRWCASRRPAEPTCRA